jgi:hypothetical protein
MALRKDTFEVVSMTENRAKYIKVGRTYCFFFNKDGAPKFTLGPHWPLMVIFCFLLFTISGIFLGYICPKVGTINLIVGIFTFLITFVFFFATALINPGIVIMSMQMKSRADFNQGMEKICNECNVVKEDFTEHCNKCRVCVEEYDNHYAVLGKCVGKNTVKYFYGLLICFLCLLVFCVTTLFFRFKDSL